MNELKSSSVAGRRRPLASALWSSDVAGGYSVARAVILVAVGTALLALSAKINLPLPYVPMTMQTLVVVMIGACYGRALGVATILAYLAEGALGLPVFAGPIGGLAYMAGPTGGFLLGFIVAAFVAGWLCERAWDASIVNLFGVMMIGHTIIIGLGFTWLAFGLHLGAEKAWLVGVLPFIAGSIVKSALGTAMMFATRKIADRSKA